MRISGNPAALLLAEKLCGSGVGDQNVDVLPQHGAADGAQLFLRACYADPRGNFPVVLQLYGNDVILNVHPDRVAVDIKNMAADLSGNILPGLQQQMGFDRYVSLQKKLLCPGGVADTGNTDVTAPDGTF